MAAGALPLGIAVFTAVKLAGYSLAGRTLNRVNNVARPRPISGSLGQSPFPATVLRHKP